MRRFWKYLEARATGHQMNWMRGEGEREESGMTPSFRPEQLEGLRRNYLR